MTNLLEKAYLDGASIAYKDCASILRHLMSVAPDNLKSIVKCFEPLAVEFEDRSKEIYTEAAKVKPTN